MTTIVYSLTAFAADTGVVHHEESSTPIVIPLVGSTWLRTWIVVQVSSVEIKRDDDLTIKQSNVVVVKV